ncbi:helix-turn-helix domain-containing protein [Gordonibacter sp. Marseille-P4307]|uniref:helix-turn-helix domain-containing protein n=1 Tax=Gordonibacter sp. Marseille-P4307 TaxID=2161815 RepID=UPI000F536217|nr:helix-turn-helix transcriptional regulator [Gordonibacter sp. Marseille-P4307]
MNRIRAERFKSGLSTEKVADLLGVHANSVRGWENGSYEPSGRNLVQLSTLFGCSPDYLLEMTDDRNERVKSIV